MPQYYYDIENCYAGNWIVDSNYIYDYGKQRNMVRERINNVYSLNVKLGLTVYQPNNIEGENKSHVERMIHSIEQMQLVEARIQGIIAAAVPAGYAIDVS